MVIGYTQRGDTHEMGIYMKKKHNWRWYIHREGIYTERGLMGKKHTMWKYIGRENTHQEVIYKEKTHMEREYMSKEQIWRGVILQSGDTLTSRNINKGRHNWWIDYPGENYTNLIKKRHIKKIHTEREHIQNRDTYKKESLK